MTKCLTADNFFKSHQKFNGKESEIPNILVTFGRRPIAIYATYLASVYFKCNAESNPHIGLVYRWRESSKIRAFNINGKIFLKRRIYPSPIVNGLERHFEKHMHPICLLKCEVNRCYWSFTLFLATETIFAECLLTPWLRITFLKVTKNLMEKKANLLSFWRRLGNAQSPPMPLVWRLFILNVMLNSSRKSVLVYTWRESNKTRAFNINGIIFLKWRIYPFPMVNGLERHFENTGSQYVCWNVK